MISDETVRELLLRTWGLGEGTSITRHDGGMGSQTWIIDQGGRRWVAKAVAPHLAEPFAHGLQVARLLGDAGISAGTPVPALSGPVTADTVSGDRVGLLTWVPGAPLTGAGEGEQRLIGETLARVHSVLRDRTVPGAQHFHWVDPAAPHLGLRPWIHPAVSAAVGELAELQRKSSAWTRGLLHADPAPEAFRYDAATGQCGIIDWSSAHYGPLLYDLASAVMYLGGPGRAAAMTRPTSRQARVPHGMQPTGCVSCSASGGPCRPTTSPGASPPATSPASPGRRRTRRASKTPAAHSSSATARGVAPDLALPRYGRRQAGRATALARRLPTAR
jgi:aminoglycoside phosphotransferase (APT) family kinase protein